MTANFEGFRDIRKHGFEYGQKVWVADVVKGKIVEREDFWWENQWRTQWWMIPVIIKISNDIPMINFINVDLLTPRKKK